MAADRRRLGTWFLPDVCMRRAKQADCVCYSRPLPRRGETRKWVGVMSLMPMGEGEGEYDNHAAIWIRALLAEMPMGSFLLELHNGYRGRVERRTFDLLEEIAKQVDERLMRKRLQESEQLESAFWRCMRSAADSSHEGKRRLLGRALANAFLDVASVDEVELLAGVLANIDTPHIAALARLHHAELEAQEAGASPARGQYAERPIIDSLREAGEREHPLVLGVLAAQGLVDVTSGFGDDEARFRGLTQFGASLLEDLGKAVPKESQEETH